jgi:choline dehydrogenase-like flavoprotein
MDNVDVLIVGSGAGGGPLALRLSESGSRVVILEKGPRYTRADYKQDELLSCDEGGLFVPAIHDDPHVVVRSDGKAEKSSLGWIACCVGGGTAHMGAALYRLHPADFAMRSRFGDFHNLADWPYRYEDLEKYYCRAEWALGVSGLGEANPFEGHRSIPLPMPPLTAHPLSSVLEKVCVDLGCHPFPTPRGINSTLYDNRPACADCTMCSGVGCPTGARGSIQETVLRMAEETGRCRVLPSSMVRQVTVDEQGFASGCIYFDSKGFEQRISARVVCVSCSAVESARLLLLSKSRLFPDGLANDTGQIGRNLQFLSTSSGGGRLTSVSHAASDLRSPVNNLGRSVMDYYFIPCNVSPLPKGGLLQFDLTRHSPIAAAQRLADAGPGALNWGEPLRKQLRDYFLDGREIEFEVFHDFIPSDGTFVELDSEVRDKWGLPVARIHLESVDHHALAGRWLLDRGMEILGALGAENLEVVADSQVGRHLIHGTCRAGVDKRTSALNQFCQSHEVSNLFVVDGSFMPTSGGVPSTLTIVANSFRTADYIIAEMRSGAFS